MAEDTKVLRTQRIEIIDDQGNTTMILDGGTAGNRDAAPGLLSHGPDGSESAVTLTMIEDDKLGISLNHSAGGWIVVSFYEEGKAVITLQDPDGKKTHFSA